MSSRTKIIAAALGLVVLLGAAYMAFFNNSADSSALTASGAPASTAEITFLNLASQIDPVTFDASVLTDPRFEALVDIHTAVTPEPIGRKDPFAPLGSN